MKPFFAKATAARRGNLCARVALWLLIASISSFHAYAQFDTGAALGVIKDQSGAAVPGANVELLSVAKGVTVTRKTDSSGDFEFDDLQAGDYKITVSASGFQVSSTDPFRVNVGARQRVDLSLKLGSANDTVIVSGAASLLETDSSGRGGTVESAQAIALPLNGRSYADLAQLVPGVRRSLLGTVASNPPRDASITSTVSPRSPTTSPSTVSITTPTRKPTRATPTKP